MNRMRKRIISLIVAAAIMLSFGALTSSASNKSIPTLNELHFLSSEIPTDATEYAKYYFSTFTSFELLNIGFSQQEIVSLRLSPGVTAYEYDKCDAPFYYFPVVSDYGVTAILTMVDFGDKYSVQFGKSDFAAALNNLDTNQKEPVILVITNDFMYALDSSNEFIVLDEFISLSASHVKKTSNPQVTFAQASMVCDIDVIVSDKTKYDETIQNTIRRNIEESYIGVPFVANTSTTAFPNGVCWASSVASIIKVRLYLPITSEQLRDNILANSSNTGSDNNIKSILDSYVSGSATVSNPRISFANIKTQINNNRPIYSHWRNASHLPYEGHAMVVRGYYSMTSPSTITRISLMDPNKTSYQTVDPSGSYVAGTIAMTWMSSVH